MREPPAAPPEARASYKPRCPECGFVLDDHEPRVLTAFGWTHPTCAPDDPIYPV